MIHILVVEDERPISDLIRLNMMKAGYACTCVYDGMAAADILEEENFDLILLDVMLPKLDGFSLMEYVRELGIPVIFLTARAGMEDKMRGLTSGAEDYIVKPFEILELLARVRIVLRRYHKLEQFLEFQDIQVDTVGQTVVKGGETVELTPKEFALFLLLLRNLNITLFRERIYEEIWGSSYPLESRTLDLHIQRLRKKLGLTDALKTVFKMGYRLEDK
ncbi:MAG: response regulator transcription factor [Muribaculaceae bacterium]|nr:response regulator transcription factor [Roseburia sp.]MCM1431022.1 response regulator transcription factor [Muribaculaceae bacterium]MCM1493282.1 response regulator transcription factor [Muribaculaceae bacterium]